MNYAHDYHAGNFADCFKHLVLLELLKSFKRKDKPFTVLDAQAGAGRYHLLGTSAQKTLEYQTGIGQLWQKEMSALPQAVQNYLAIVKSHNPQADVLRFYPGSPLFIQHELRAHDKLHCVDLHPRAYEKLGKLFKDDKRVKLHQMDSYQSLRALLPPIIRRGLVVIDPSFETPQEERLIVPQLIEALTRWPEATYMVWYPIKEPGARGRIKRRLEARRCSAELLDIHLDIMKNARTSLQSCGLLIINPPFQIAQALNTIKNFLSNTLRPIHL